MVALNPHFALLAVQSMALLAALPSPATAIAVRPSHSNGPSHFRQRYKPRDDSHDLEVNVSPAGFQAKKTRGLQARDPPTPDDLQKLIASLLDPLDTVINTLKSLLTGLVRRRHDDDDYCYDCDIDGHDRSRRSFLESSKRDTDLIAGTALVTGDGGSPLGFLELNGTKFSASANKATTLFLKPSDAGPASDGQEQRVQLVVASVGPTLYCATYDPNPSEPSEMNVEHCSSRPTYHQSQFFLYNAALGTLQPTNDAGGDSFPTTDHSSGEGDDQATNGNVRRSSGTSLRFIPQEMGMKDISPSTTTVTVTETATQADSSSMGMPIATPPIPANASNPLDSMPTPNPGFVSPPLPGVVEVGYPSNTSTSISPGSSSVSSTLSTDPSSVAASIASTEDATTTSEPSTPTPASLIVEVTQPEASSA